MEKELFYILIFLGGVGFLVGLYFFVVKIGNKSLENDYGFQLGKNKVGNGMFILLFSSLLIITALFLKNSKPFKEVVELFKDWKMNENQVSADNSSFDKSKLLTAEAKDKCELLAKTGYFEFHQKSQYFFSSDKFTEKYHLRAIATNGNWSDLACQPVEGKPDYILEGVDTSEHKIEKISSDKDGKVFLSILQQLKQNTEQESVSLIKKHLVREIFSVNWAC